MAEFEIDYLNKFLIYCPASGIIRWKKSKGRRSAGSVAGVDNGRGYIVIGINRRQTYAHRIAFEMMTGRAPKFIDHINGDRSDNRWVNIREVTPSENSMNMRKPITNSSGAIGVSWDKRLSKWYVQIKFKRKKRFIGRFDDFEIAVLARKEAERQLGFHENHGRS